MKIPFKNKIVFILFLLKLTHQYQINILRITKGIYNEERNFNKNAYLFQIYNWDQEKKYDDLHELFIGGLIGEKYKDLVLNDFLSKGVLPDYDKFNLAFNNEVVFNSELQNFHLKFQLMGDSNTNTKFFKNFFFDKKLTESSKENEFNEDYFFFFENFYKNQHQSKWNCYFNMYEENNLIKIDFLTIKQTRNILDLFYVKPKIQGTDFIFDLENLNKKITGKNKKFIIPLENPEENPAFLNFLVLAKGGLLNYRYKGFIKNQEDINNFKNYLGAFDSKKIQLKSNKFNYISGFFMTDLYVKPGIFASFFKFNTIIKNDQIEVKITNFNNLPNSSKANLSHSCTSNLINENILLSNYENTDFKIVMKTSTNAKLTFKFYENNYEKINTKINREFEFHDFMIEQIFPEDRIKCKISAKEEISAENVAKLKINIEIIIKPNDEIQTKAKITFSEENLELNLSDNFFKESSKNISFKKCEIRNPEEYKSFENQEIYLKNDAQENKVKNKSEKIFEMGLLYNENEINRCFLYIQNKIKKTYLEIMIEKKTDIKYYPKLILNVNENSFKLFLSKDKSVQCSKFNENINATEMIKTKKNFIETRVQHDTNKFEFNNFWKSLEEEEEGNFYLNLGQGGQDDSLVSALKTIFYEGKECFVKIKEDTIQVNIFLTSTKKLKFKPSQLDINFYNEAILLSETNPQIAKTTNLRLKKLNLSFSLYRKIFHFYVQLSETNQEIFPFELIEADLDIFVISMISKIPIMKNIQNFNSIFFNSENFILSIEDLSKSKTLQITIWKSNIINEENLNTGLYSLNSLELIGHSFFFKTRFIYKDSEKSLSCETEIIREYTNEKLSKDNRFFFEKNKPIDEEEPIFIMETQAFIPLIKINEKPEFQIKRNTIYEDSEERFIFSNIFYTTPNEKLLFLCFYPDESRLNLNVYDLNSQDNDNDKIASYQNYSINIIIYKEKKNIFLENISNSNINIEIKFIDKKIEKIPKFIRDLNNVKCEYINLKNVADDNYFIPKIDIKKKSGLEGIDVNVILEEKKKKKILI